MINNMVTMVKITIITIIQDVIPIVVDVIDRQMMKLLVPNNKMMGKKFRPKLFLFFIGFINFKGGN